MNNITNISPASTIHLQFTALKKERRKRLLGQIVCGEQAIRFSRLVYTEKRLNNTSPDRPDGEIQGADIPMWSVIRKQIKDACRLAIKGFLLRSVFEFFYSERRHYISIPKYTFQNPAKVSSSAVPPKDSKAVKSLRSLQVAATPSCPTFCRTSSTSSTGSAILNDLSNSFERLRAFVCTTSIAALQRIPESLTDVYRPLHGPCSYSKLLPKPNWKKLEQVGTSSNKLLRQVLYHRQLLKHCKAGAFVSWKRATFWQPTSCLQTFTNKLRTRKDPFQNKYDYPIHPICFHILMRYGIGPGAPLLAVLHPAMSSSSAR